MSVASFPVFLLCVVCVILTLGVHTTWAANGGVYYYNTNWWNAGKAVTATFANTDYTSGTMTKCSKTGSILSCFVFFFFSFFSLFEKRFPSSFFYSAGWYYTFLSYGYIQPPSTTMYFSTGTSNDYSNCGSGQYPVSMNGLGVVVNTTSTSNCGGTLTSPFCKTLRMIHNPFIFETIFDSDPSIGLVGSTCMPKSVRLYYYNTAFTSTVNGEAQLGQSLGEIFPMVSCSTAGYFFAQMLDYQTSMEIYMKQGSTLDQCLPSNGGYTFSLSSSNPSLLLNSAVGCTGQTFGSK